MLYQNVRVMGTYLAFLDAAACGVCGAASLWTLGRLEPKYSLAAVPPGALVVFPLAMMLSFIALAYRLRAYHPRRTERVVHELTALSELYLLSAAIAVSATEFLTAGLDATNYLVTLAAGLVAVMGLRVVVIRALLRRARRGGRDDRAWLLVGWNERAKRLKQAVDANPGFGVRIVDVVDFPRADKGGIASRDGTTEPRIHELWEIEELRVLLNTNAIDEVVVTLPLRSHYDAIQAILGMCEEAGISVKMPPDTFVGNGTNRSAVVLVGSMPLVTYYSGPAEMLQLACKRAVDVVGAFLGLVILTPVFALIAIAIKLDSRGPVLFRSTRVGLHGRTFTMVKFRSMVENAPDLRDALQEQTETDGVAFKIRNDPRITRAGKFLRGFHLDELPQLWNVLLGDMSLVGPRPLPVGEAMGTEWWQRRRLSMPPGLTCYWQIAGDHQMPFAEWVRLDLSYIDDWSLWLDLKLIFATVAVLGRRQGW